MNLEYLKTFYITVQCNSISKAAKLLHMSQPGVSIQLQALEKELNFDLLKRSNKGVTLTDAGKIVYEYAISILSILDNLNRQLNSLKLQKTELVVSTCTTIGSYIIPGRLYYFKENNPHINVFLNITNSDTVINNILNGVTKIGIIEGCMDKVKELNFFNIGKGNLRLVASPKFIKSDKICLKTFAKLPLILREKGSGVRNAFIKTLTNFGFNINNANVILELCSTEAIKSAVICDKCISILPYSAVQKELSTKILKEIKLENINFETEYNFVYNKQSILKENENIFKNFIIANKKNFFKRA